MCVKLLLENLNPGSCPPHYTRNYTCGVTIASMVRGDTNLNIGVEEIG